MLKFKVTLTVVDEMATLRFQSTPESDCELDVSYVQDQFAGLGDDQFYRVSEFNTGGICFPDSICLRAGEPPVPEEE